MLVKFGVELDGAKEVADLDLSMAKTLKTVNLLTEGFKALAIVKVASIAKEFIQAQIDEAVQLKYGAERLGITTDELQGYAYVADIAGVQTNQMAWSIRFFNRAVGEAHLGTGAAVKTFALLGINIHDAQGQIKPTADLLGEFSDKLLTMKSEAERTAFATRLLGRGGASMLPVFQKGSAAIKEMFKDIEELGDGLNPDFVEAAAAVNYQQKRLNMGWKTMSVLLANELLPLAKKWIESGIKTVKVMIDYAKHTYGLRTALIALGVISAVVTAAMLAQWAPILIPLAAIAAVITTLYLYFDDFYTLLQGGNSVLGEFLDKIGGKGTSAEFVKELKDAWKELTDAFDNSGLSLKNIWKILADDLPGAISFIGNAFIDVVQVIDMAVAGLRQLWASAKLLKNFLSGDTAGAKGNAQEINDISGNLDRRLESYKKVGQVFTDIGTPGVFAKRKADREAAQATADAVNGDNNYDARTGLVSPTITLSVTNHIAGNMDKATADHMSDRMKQLVKDAVTEKANRDTWEAANAGFPQAVQ